MRNSIESENGYGDGGVQAPEDKRIERVLPNKSTLIAKPALQGYGVTYTGNDGATIRPDVVPEPTHPIINVMP